MLLSKRLLVRMYLSNNSKVITMVPISVAARSKTWVYGRLLSGIAGSNPAGDMDVCLL
jgi:hypothetical protein